MKLYGSTTSPYVRRIRIFTYSMALDFKTIDIFSEQDRQWLKAQNPTLKVPFLMDGEQCIFDSRVIFRYLVDRFSLTPLTWQQENLLTLIDSLNDTLVTLFLLTRSDIDTQDDVMFFNLQHQRIEQVMASLENACANGDFSQWHYPSICLYCLLDWVCFRNLLDISGYPALIALHQRHKQRADVLATVPQ